MKPRYLKLPDGRWMVSIYPHARWRAHLHVLWVAMTKQPSAVLLLIMSPLLGYNAFYPSFGLDTFVILVSAFVCAYLDLHRVIDHMKENILFVPDEVWEETSERLTTLFDHIRAQMEKANEPDEPDEPDRSDE